MMLKEKIQQLARSSAEEFVQIRRHLHAHPELSYQEFQTSAFVKEKLSGWHIPFQSMAGTGVVALIEGKNPASRTIALRADMDALPIAEQNNVDYKSVYNGVMHACGHDVHTTCLLGAANILQQTKEDWEGTVKLIFQPGEERNPGGASILIREGVLQNPAPQGIVGLHVHPGLPIGKLSFRKGRVMASADEIFITIKSSGGHAAAPHLTVDTILVASHIIVALQQIISRNNNPTSPSVLSICSVQGGYTTNVIPSEVKLMGTFRAMDEKWRWRAHGLIEKQVKGIAEAMGAEADILIDVGYPTWTMTLFLPAKPGNWQKNSSTRTWWKKRNCGWGLKILVITRSRCLDVFSGWVCATNPKALCTTYIRLCLTLMKALLKPEWG